MLSQNNGFSPVTHESVQIHHTGHFHWVTSCSVGGEIQVYDSRFAVGPLSPSLQIQLAQIYRVSVQEEEDVDKILTVKVPAVQQQTGKVDYGILAIAFAYHAASGDNPADLQFQQERMRDHLLQCFKKKQLTPFSSHGPGQTTKARCIPLSRDRSIL